MAPVGGKYRLGERLGGGGMAEVFRATLTGAEGFARPVAIKRILPTLSVDPAFADMFVNEARIASLLMHPNIVQVLDFDRDAEDRLFLVMELVEGKNLRQVMEIGRLPVATSALVIAEVLRALVFAHDLEHQGKPMSIVHRDVSPHNVMVSWGGAVKLGDFGIAKAIAASGAAHAGSLKGKVGYMSPEQANGFALDGRSDLFAVGVMLHELLVGGRLFGGTTEAEVLSRLLAQPIASPSELNAEVCDELDFVCMQLLARDRAQRFASAPAALDALLGCDVITPRGPTKLARLLRTRFPDDAPKRAGRSAPGASTPIATGIGSAPEVAEYGPLLPANRAAARLMPDVTRTRAASRAASGVAPTAAGERRGTWTAMPAKTATAVVGGVALARAEATAGRPVARAVGSTHRGPALVGVALPKSRAGLIVAILLILAAAGGVGAVFAVQRGKRVTGPRVERAVGPGAIIPAPIDEGVARPAPVTIGDAPRVVAPTDPEPTEPAEPTAVVSSHVTIQLRWTVPLSDATITVDGDRINGLSVTLPRSDDEVKVVVSAKRFRTRVFTFAPDQDKSVKIPPLVRERF